MSKKAKVFARLICGKHPENNLNQNLKGLLGKGRFKKKLNSSARKIIADDHGLEPVSDCVKTLIDIKKFLTICKLREQIPSTLH